MARKRGNSSKSSRDKILNAFDTAVDDDYYIRGLRHQQDIDLDHISDDRIRQLLSNQVDSENDEEIDSDEAMGSASDISLGEPESENEDEWGDSYDESELLPLSEIWDLDDKEKAEEANEAKKQTPKNKELEADRIQKPKAATAGAPVESHTELESQSDAESESESGSGSESDSDEGSDAGSESESEELELSEVSDSSDDDGNDEALVNAIKNVSGGDDIGPSSRRLADADEENPFALPGTSSNKEISVQELIPGAREGKTLSVPAPKRVQERADRSAALGLTKKELGKWSDVVMANRQAEHLQFPINAPPELEGASAFVAPPQEEQTSLENNVSKILKESALADENAISTFEELAPSKLSIEEVRRRRNELRYMRELMYREEQRAKRIKKIKSKSYHKVHKKERERMNELENDEDDEETVAKAERARALERATLRHRASSKWAKRMADQGLTRDAGTRSEIEEMLRQGEALKQKIRDGFESEQESEDDSETERQRFEQDNATKLPEKGVLGMKFMREAEDRERKANARRLRDDYSDDDSGEENVGRKSFTPAGQQLKRDLAAREEAEGGHSSEDDEQRDISVKKNSRKRRSKSDKNEVGSEVVELRRRDDSESEEAESEPEKGGFDRSSRKEGGREPSSEARSQKGRHSAGRESDLSASTSTIEANPWLAAASANTSTPGTVKLTKSSKSETGSGKPTGRNNTKTISVENTLGDTMVRAKDMTLQQQDLVREAFAGDDVVAEFEAEKSREAEEDGDKEIDETLPGWGTWSSEKPRVQKVRKITGIKKTDRKDYNKKNVILNEKLNKKTAKYSASAVPFPFENRQQYERSLRMPIGQEWVTSDTFQRQTKPRVLVKPGSVIDPIRKPHSN